jgi:glycosyltransferase involved in cell wall biosynthesis
MRTPYFSLVVTTYNRADIILRSVNSCLNQSFTDLEVVVVDDASVDATPTVLRQITDPRLVLVKHPENRGISPTKRTGVLTARGAWVVVVDSDWELLPHALDRLYEVTVTVPETIGVVRARMRWDTGKVTPSFVPEEPIGYEGRIRWVDVEGGSDALMCTRRQVYDRVCYEPDRRGTQEGLFQLNIAQNTKSLYLDDVLCLQYSDAPNSTTRGRGAAHMDSLRRNATDMLWMYEQTLSLHGEALKKWGPRQYHMLFRGAALESFYMGRRRSGLDYVLRYLRFQPGDIFAWLILGLGVLGSRPALHGNLLKRRLGI